MVLQGRNSSSSLSTVYVPSNVRVHRSANSVLRDIPVNAIPVGTQHDQRGIGLQPRDSCSYLWWIVCVQRGHQLRHYNGIDYAYCLDNPPHKVIFLICMIYYKPDKSYKNICGFNCIWAKRIRRNRVQKNRS